MDKRIRTILEYAIMAPSGDNCQPWKFSIDGMIVELYNDPRKDTSLYNIKQRASLIAHGALLENIHLAAPASGLQADIQLLPSPSDENHIATVTFTEGEQKTHPYVAAIVQRHTNREAYLPTTITSEELNSWQDLVTDDGQTVFATTDADAIKTLAKLLSLNDKLVFSVPDLHRFLFEQIRWNDAQARQSSDGLDIKTLGLNAMDKQAFRFLKNWPLVALLNNVGFSRIIQLKAQQLINTASAIAILAIPGSTPVDYLRGGMLWQRLQLRLAAEGLTSQPIAGLACLMQSGSEGALTGKLTSAQLETVEKKRLELQKIAGLDEVSVILTMLRIGQGRNVTRALRKPLDHFC